MEPLAGLYRESADMARAVVKNALACEIAGADSVLFNMGNEYDQRRRKLISLLADSLNINLAVKTGLDDRSLDALTEIRPAMVVFPYQPERRDSLTHLVTNLQVENILVGLEIALEVEHVRDAAKLKCDYVIFNCEPYASAGNTGAQIDEINQISKLAALSGRLSLGSAASADFTPNQLSRMNAAVQFEEYVVGLHFFSNALIHGYDKAMDILRFSIK